MLLLKANNVKSVYVCVSEGGGIIYLFIYLFSFYFAFVVFLFLIYLYINTFTKDILKKSLI